MERLLELLGPAVQFVYTCWDRIVLNGYLERLQRPENLVYFFHDIVGVACIEPAVLELRSNAYKAWVRRVTDELGIPVQAAPPAPPKGVRKEDVVQPFYRHLKGGQGIACVLTSLEQGRTFVSYTPRWTPASGDANYRLIKAYRKRFLHYYWYGATRASTMPSLPASTGSTVGQQLDGFWTPTSEVHSTTSAMRTFSSDSGTSRLVARSRHG